MLRAPGLLLSSIVVIWSDIIRTHQAFEKGRHGEKGDSQSSVWCRETLFKDGRWRDECDTGGGARLERKRGRRAGLLTRRATKSQSGDLIDTVADFYQMSGTSLLGKVMLVLLACGVSWGIG